MRRLFLASILLLFALPALAGVEGYYRQPALGDGQLVFVSEGDLWRVGTQGGTAQRLTAGVAPATDPALSPDGRRLAFTGRYAGAAEVYVMPADGGQPQRLTWEGADVEVQGWTRDQRILYSTTAATGPSGHRTLRLVDPGSGETEELELADARAGTIDAEGNIWFLRFGLALTGDHVRQYRGGARSQLWRYHPDRDAEARRVAPEHAGNLEHPLRHEGRLYVLSDVDGIANLGRLDPASGAFEPLTRHRDFEVRDPSLSGGRIVYQHGADLRALDLASGADRRIDIRLPSDRPARQVRWIDNPADYLDSIGFAPRGDRVAVTARGSLAVIGSGRMRRMEIALPAASRARQGAIDPTGEWVYTFVDASGETELWRFPADGRGQGERLTDDGDVLRTGLSVSPDGRHVAHHDLAGRLWLHDVGGKTNRLIDDSGGTGYQDLAWSVDSALLAVVRPDSDQLRTQILLIDLAASKTQVVTSDRYVSHSPAFSPDGRWLYFLSNRHFTATPSSPWGDRNMGPAFDRRAGIYAVALQAGNRFPLQPRTELIDESLRHEPPEQVPAVDWPGLADRLHEVPVAPGNYGDLQVGTDRLYVVDRPTGQPPRLMTIDFARNQPRLDTFAEGLDLVRLSADPERSQMLVRRAEGGELLIVPAAGSMPPETDAARVRIDGWRLAVDPAAEWRQMFHDAWRMQRDYLYDPQLRGRDWTGIAEKYGALVERIGTRRELDDLLGQMVAELGVLHSQVRGGEYRDNDEAPEPAFLGGEFEPVADGLRITRVYRSDPELPAERSPLAHPGVALEPGDIITRVNGRAVKQRADLAERLAHQAGEQVRIDFLRGSQAGSVIAHPVDAATDAMLRYRDWVSGRRQAVAAAADGRIGYLHLRAMTSTDIADFAREFYTHFNREGLIIDLRRNRGGNIDSWVIEKLLRRAWAFWEKPGQPRHWNMQQTFRGHLAVLIDPLTYSDGETFAAGVKTLGLGPLIGQRSAGAGVWLSDNNRLVDSGIMRAASSPQFDRHGRWMIEGFGVEPDIEVANLPHATYRGADAQLERAIEVLLDALADDPVIDPRAQALPPLGRSAGDSER